MRVSAIHIDITENDLFGILKEVLDEFVKVNGLSIKTLSINNNIQVTGEVKRGLFTLRFMAILRVLGVQENSISLSIEKLKVLGIPIMGVMVTSILKMVLKSFDKIGIKMENGILSVDLNLLAPLIPFVDFKVKSIELLDGGVSIEVVELNYDSKKETASINKLLGKEKYKEEETIKNLEKASSPDINLEEGVRDNLEEVLEDSKKGQCFKSSPVDDEFDEFEKEFSRRNYKKTKDGYTKVRSKIQHRLPEKCEEYSDIIFAVPDLMVLVCRLFKDKRVSLKNKVIIGIMLGYSVAPIDIIPEKIKVLGKIDDTVIFLIGLNRLLNCLDEDIVLENWQGEEQIIGLIKKGVSFGSDKLGGKVKTAINLIDTMM